MRTDKFLNVRSSNAHDGTPTCLDLRSGVLFGSVAHIGTDAAQLTEWTARGSALVIIPRGSHRPGA